MRRPAISPTPRQSKPAALSEEATRRFLQALAKEQTLEGEFPIIAVAVEIWVPVSTTL